MIETRSSSSSSTWPLTIPRKVCMIFKAPSLGYDIFIADLNTDLRDLSPTIRVVGEFFKSSAFCVLGTTLYVFEGFGGGRRGKSVSLYDFSEHNKAEGLITLSGKKQLKFVCLMNDFKISPEVIPTPDGKKIVVFSTSKNHIYSYSSCNFELFDPFAATPECTKLPDLYRCPFSTEIGAHVQLFSFLNKDEFFVQTSLPIETHRAGMYKLNLVDQGSCWEPFLFSDQLRLDDRFQVIGDDICLTPKKVLRINVPGFRESVSSNKCWFYKLPVSVFSPPDRVFLQSDITLFGNHPEERWFCILRKCISQEDENNSQGVSEDKDIVYAPLVILDVYKCNLPQCKKEMVEFEEKQREVYKCMVEFEEKQREIIKREKIEMEKQREIINMEKTEMEKQRETPKTTMKKKKKQGGKIETNKVVELAKNKNESLDKIKEKVESLSLDKIKEKVETLLIKEKVETLLPGTELVKSFKIKFNPQPSAFFLLPIYPLRAFFSIP